MAGEYDYAIIALRKAGYNKGQIEEIRQRGARAVLEEAKRADPGFGDRGFRSGSSSTVIVEDPSGTAQIKRPSSPPQEQASSPAGVSSGFDPASGYVVPKNQVPIDRVINPFTQQAYRSDQPQIRPGEAVMVPIDRVRQTSRGYEADLANRVPAGTELNRTTINPFTNRSVGSKDQPSQFSEVADRRPGTRVNMPGGFRDNLNTPIGIIGKGGSEVVYGTGVSRGTVGTNSDSNYGRLAGLARSSYSGRVATSFIGTVASPFQEALIWAKRAKNPETYRSYEDFFRGKISYSELYRKQTKDLPNLKRSTAITAASLGVGALISPAISFLPSRAVTAIGIGSTAFSGAIAVSGIVQQKTPEGKGRAAGQAFTDFGSAYVGFKASEGIYESASAAVKKTYANLLGRYTLSKMNRDLVDTRLTFQGPIQTGVRPEVAGQRSVQLTLRGNPVTDRQVSFLRYDPTRSPLERYGIVNRIGGSERTASGQIGLQNFGMGGQPVVGRLTESGFPEYRTLSDLDAFFARRFSTTAPARDRSLLQFGFSQPLQTRVVPLSRLKFRNQDLFGRAVQNLPAPKPEVPRASITDTTPMVRNFPSSNTGTISLVEEESVAGRITPEFFNKVYSREPSLTRVKSVRVAVQSPAVTVAPPRSLFTPIPLSRQSQVQAQAQRQSQIGRLAQRQAQVLSQSARQVTQTRESQSADQSTVARSVNSILNIPRTLSPTNQRQGQTTRQLSTVIPRQDQGQSTRTPRPPSIRFPGPPVPPPPRTPRIPFDFKVKFPKAASKPVKFGRERTQYQPSLTAIVFGIKSKRQPKSVRGFEVRPVIESKRSKKKSVTGFKFKQVKFPKVRINVQKNNRNVRRGF